MQGAAEAAAAPRGEGGEERHARRAGPTGILFVRLLVCRCQTGGMGATPDSDSLMITSATFISPDASISLCSIFPPCDNVDPTRLAPTAAQPSLRSPSQWQASRRSGVRNSQRPRARTTRGSAFSCRPPARSRRRGSKRMRAARAACTFQSDCHAKGGWVRRLPDIACQGRGWHPGCALPPILPLGKTSL